MFQKPVTSVFGDASVVFDTPIFQITAAYLSLAQTDSFLSGSGNTGAENSMFYAATGTDINGFATLLSFHPLIYRAGQGAKARLTAIFDTPKDNSLQFAGLLNTTDRLGFGYFNTTFGIFYQKFGLGTIQELQVTTQAGGAENATVTLNGTAYTVPLTAGTVQHNAIEIAASMTSQESTWSFAATDDTVVAASRVTGTTAGAFTFSSATAVASWTLIIDGVPFETDFYSQAQWNRKTNRKVDAQKLMPYQISFQYLGGGQIDFAVENGETGRFDVVHSIKYAQTKTRPSVSNPSYRLGIAVANLGNITDLKIQTASFAGFIEGVLGIFGENNAAHHTALAVGTAEISIISVRNRIVFDKKGAITEIRPIRASAASDGLKPIEVNIYIDATFSTPLVYDYIDKDDSIAEISKDQQTITGGFIVYSGAVGNIDLETLNLHILPGRTLTIAMNVSQVPAAAMTASLNWLEIFA